MLLVGFSSKCCAESQNDSPGMYGASRGLNPTLLLGLLVDIMCANAYS